MTLFAVLSSVMLAQHLHVLGAEYPAVEVGGVPLLHRHVVGQVLVKPGLVLARLSGAVAHAVQLCHQQHQEDHHGHCGHHGQGHQASDLYVLEILGHLPILGASCCLYWVSAVVISEDG